MSQTIHFGEKFRTELARYFASKSDTEAMFNHNIDAEFNGSDIVHILAIATTPLNSYDKTVDPSTGSRFGKVQEVADHKYTFKLTQDVSLDRSVDRGNNDAQFNVKKVGAIMKAYTDKEIRPAKDKYRLKKWAEEAGIHSAMTAAPTKDTIVTMIVELHNEMIDRGCPEDGCTLVISREWVPALTLAKEWISLDKLGGETLPKGCPGKIDGLTVKPVSKRKMPANCYFAIYHKESIISPEKINTFRGIKDSENMDGDRIQFRLKYDAFVMPNLCEGAAVACAKGTVATTPTIALSGADATIAAGTGEAIYYTTDGSDPRYKSAEASVYTAKVTLKDGDTIKACAKKDGLWASEVAEMTYTAG